MRYLMVLVLVACGEPVDMSADASPIAADWSGTYSLEYGAGTGGNCSLPADIDTEAALTGTGGGMYSVAFEPSGSTDEGYYSTWLAGAKYVWAVNTPEQVDIQGGQVQSFVVVVQLQWTDGGTACHIDNVPVTGSRI